MKYLKYLPVLLLMMVTGCKKYLDVTPKGLLIPKTVNDFDLILNSTTSTFTFPAHVFQAADDVKVNFTLTNISSEARAYFWIPDIDVDPEVFSSVWGLLYRSIYNANIIIRYINDATEGTQAQKDALMGEAMLNKAECYFTLLTMFAKSYKASTAATDPGLPLINTLDITTTTPQRSSLKATMDEIIQMCQIASQTLPENTFMRLRANKYAGYGLLARVYLYAAQYDSAEFYANKALVGTHQLLDYNTVTKTTMPNAELNAETLWMRYSNDASVPNGRIYSDSLMSYFDQVNDLRWTYLTTATGPVLPGATVGRYQLARGFQNFGLSYPEMYLTLAECLARRNDITGAMAQVNFLRRRRIKTTAFVNMTASAQEDAIVKVLAERRRELAFHGRRWMDMKRLDADGRMPEVKRIQFGATTVLATLPPGSPNYTFEIPLRVRNFNPDMIKNH